MPKPTTGLPVFLMPSTTRCVHWSSMPITTTAATFGFDPVPISVRKCSSRSAPNCRRPYGCGIAITHLLLFSTDCAAALDRSSTGSTITWLRTPTRLFSRTYPLKLAFERSMLMSPPLRLDVLHVRVLALGDRRHDLADIDPVLDDGVARLVVLQSQ